MLNKLNKKSVSINMLSIKRILKFQVFNWLGTFVNFPVLWLLHGVFDVHLIIASLFAIELAIIHNFTWHYFVTWNDRVHRNAADYFNRLLKFNILTGSVDLIVSPILLWSLTEYFGIYYLLSNLLIGFIVPFLRFIISEFFIFNLQIKHLAEQRDYKRME